MNDPEHKAALGVNPYRTFETCNTEVNKAFVMSGDGMHNSAILLPELVDGGVRLLVYAGNAGSCSFLLSDCCIDFFARHDVQLYSTEQSLVGDSN